MQFLRIVDAMIEIDGNTINAVNGFGYNFLRFLNRMISLITKVEFHLNKMAYMNNY
ncbi:hypothetical protein BARBAKC583_0522 [Bartonella bacilliformis KC583]|uniref:Uncharacterized protein n=1 Tax=Bartonella bacilliformis (strain ATCC 35685 / KC583 / Herrer 020/F12,63) TaxID=360095 RepID=A1US84_BARBK|nr:hypothetical protein BARBAKC583_0522 [Bartonella bacilliformis KC583]